MDGVVVRESEGVAEVGEGGDFRGVEDVVDAERGKFADVGVAQASAAFGESVFQSDFHLAVGVGKGRVVEVAAEDDGVGGTAEVAGDLLRLLCAVAGGEGETACQVAGAIGEVAFLDALPEVLDEGAVFTAETVGFEVDVVDAEGVVPHGHVHVEAGAGAFLGEGEMPLPDERQAREYRHVVVDVAVGVGVQAVGEAFLVGAAGFQGKLLEADEVAVVAVEVIEHPAARRFVLRPVVVIEVADVVGEDGDAGVRGCLAVVIQPVIGQEGGHAEEQDDELQPCHLFPAQRPVEEQDDVAYQEVGVHHAQKGGQDERVRIDVGGGVGAYQSCHGKQPDEIHEFTEEFPHGAGSLRVGGQLRPERKRMAFSSAVRLS